MKLIEKTPRSMSCLIGNCPAVFETDRNTYVVIGELVSSDQVCKLLKERIGKNEVAVEFPKELLGDLI